MGCEHDFKLENGNKICTKCGHKIYVCEVYSRVVGYIRPVSNWNDSKQSEFHDRKLFDGGIKNV